MRVRRGGRSMATCGRNVLANGRTASLVAVAIAASILPAVMGSYYLSVLNLGLIYAILVIGYNFTLGYTGQVSLAQVGFFAIGAYTSARLATAPVDMNPLIALGLGVVLTTSIALVLALIVARLRSHYLALATLGFAEIVGVVLSNWTAMSKGINGIGGIPPLQAFGMVARSQVQAYVVLVIAVALAGWVAWRLQTGSVGRRYRAVKDGELMASALGIDVVRVRIGAFLVSAAYASIAGSLYAQLFGFVSPSVFSFSTMITVLLMLVIGGQGTVSGAIIGAIVLTMLPQWFQSVGQYYVLFYGVAVLVIIVVAPSGISGFLIRVARLGEHTATKSDSGPDPTSSLRGVMSEGT
ncbi:MAG: branched-chain amino acid ABC transporter permease [Acidimicrobiales bacterium]